MTDYPNVFVIAYGYIAHPDLDVRSRSQKHLKSIGIMGFWVPEVSGLEALITILYKSVLPNAYMIESPPYVHRFLA